MKKFLIMFITLILCLSICGCNTVSDNDYKDKEESNSDYSSSYEDEYDYSYSYDDYSSFSNKYGSSTTICAEVGCNNYIASSGDTNCCVSHSNKCPECGCYIDGDAIYCIDCFSDTAEELEDDYSYGGNSSYGGNNSYGQECYVCGEEAYSKYGSYYYCSSCLAIVKAFS